LQLEKPNGNRLVLAMFIVTGFHAEDIEKQAFTLKEAP